MNALSPKLRFSEFNNKWNKHILGKLSDVRDGTHDSPKYVDKGYPLITSKNLNENGVLDFKNVEFITQFDFDNINRRSKVDKGDIIFGMIGTIGNPVLLNRDDFAIKNVALIKEKNELKNTFLIQNLKSNHILRQIYKENVGGTQKFVSLSVIRNLEVFLPSIEEQNKISVFLSNVDNKINQLTKKKELLEQYKKGIMQKIFNQEIRFKDDNGNDYPEWYEKTLDDIATINMGQSPSSNSYNIDGNGLMLIQGNADIKDRKTNPRQWTSQPTKKCEIGDIILTVRAPVGFVSKSIHKACIGRGVCSIKSKDQNNNEFVYQFLLYFEDKWGKLEQGSTFTAVSGSEIKSILLEVPSFKEQDKIATFLSSIDSKINSINIQLEGTKEFKKGLLQQMFV
ncbi:restriction endonuclease subunit S [Flavobacterium sp.]|uniref:restriction endonuclease subunit S n=1 Tax=Flavobacterium sp. TaxID=239 RepID=UPI0033408C01